MAAKGPGKAHRKGVTLAQLVQMFPDDAAAAEWFEGIFWGAERCCPKCGGLRTKRTKNAKPMPYWCGDCRKYFSVRTGTVMARSHISLQNWAFAIYLAVTNLKGVSSMKLHRDLGISQKAAWFMLHRIREALASDPRTFAGPVEVDETYIGGLEKNRHAKDRKNLGRGPVGKTAVVGAKDRATKQVVARVIERTRQGDVAGLPWTSTRPRTRNCTRTTRRPTRARNARTRRSSKAPESMSGAWPTRTAWRASGAC